LKYRLFSERKSISGYAEKAERFWHETCFQNWWKPVYIGKRKKGGLMLETILIILVILWALGFFAFHVGGLIHIVLVIAVVILVIRLLQGRRVL
jgi:hypothetical protein